MSDIFISYSSKDKEKADQLSELLASAGLSVWIDQSALDVATSWSAEIVDAINGCQAFIVLLSPNSIESHNVIKEVSLASEKRKKILPLDLEPVALPRELEYQLAGIHRTSMTNIDAIIRALGKLGLEATGAPQAPKIVKETDGRKSLMILPFEDLSPTGDNGWFADGIVTELIAALSTVKALRVTDAQTTKDFKRYQGTLANYAHEMAVQYFVQGSVRKFGDQLKITASLLDIETGDHLWQESMKGTMENVFDIQEVVAKKVVDALKLHLGSDQEKLLAEHGTKNAEAYEFYLKAAEYSRRATKEGDFLQIQQANSAIELDPDFAKAYVLKAEGLLGLYRDYERDAHHLVEAEALAKRALVLKPDLWDAYDDLSIVYRHQGDLLKAEKAIMEYVRGAPEVQGNERLGLFFAQSNQYGRAIEYFEKAIELVSVQRNVYYNLVVASERAGDQGRTHKWSCAALPIFEKRLRLVPDDDIARMAYIYLLSRAREVDRALKEAAFVVEKPNVDSGILFNVLCLYARAGDTITAMTLLQRALATGYVNIDSIRIDPDLDVLRDLPEFQELVRQLEAKLNV